MGDKPGVTCCLCREPVEASGWCGHCQTWPINVTPLRYCGAAHLVRPDGWCPRCHCYQATELLPEPGEWRDTCVVPKLLTKESNQTHALTVAARFNGPGWPEKPVPLREDMIPRRWNRVRLQKIGLTPLGYPIVFPASEPQPDQDSETPF